MRTRWRPTSRHGSGKRCQRCAKWWRGQRHEAGGGPIRHHGLGSYVPVKSALAAGLLVLVLAAPACSQPATTPSAGKPAVLNGKPNPPRPSLADAIRVARDLGPAGAATQVNLNFTLKTRQKARLDALLASGRTASPDEYAAEFGPDPTQVNAAIAQLQQFGFAPSGEPGSQLIAVDGPAPNAAALLRLRTGNYLEPDGSTFYAALAAPRLTGPLAAVGAELAGLDRY